MNVEQLLGHLKRLGTTLTLKQMITLGVVFAGVVAMVVGSAYYVNTPSYTLLFSDLDAESAASVVAKLKTDKVPYELDGGGRTVRVPSSRVDELRLGFASQGLPTTGRIGFEIFDRTAFGATEFLEHVNYRRALEGELARTISTIAEVSSARVHIALAKDTLFANDSQPAKASVVLKLKSSRPPSAAMIAGIAGLVSGSVESLRPESVVIVDTYGRPLSKRVDGADEIAGMPLERQHQVERDLAAKVVALVEPIVGDGRVRVNVAARISGDSEETTEERWDPTTVIRSQQSTSDGGGFTGAQGIAGARANAPPTASTAPRVTPLPAAPSSALAATRTSETTNYEVSKTTRHTIVPRGQLARLSVAVVVDDEHVTAKDASGQTRTTSKARSAADLQRLHGLVAAAVGFDEERGDQLTVENIAFDATPVDETPAPAWWQRVAPQVVPEVGAMALLLTRVAVVLGLGALGFLLVLRPMARRALRLPEPAALAVVSGPPRTVADLEGEIEAELDAGVMRPDSRRLPVLTRRIAKVADKEPEHLARLVRSWMAEDER